MGLFNKKPKTVCAYCKKQAEINQLSLCKGCEQWVEPTIKRHLQIIDESYKILMSTRNKETFYGRVQTYIENINKLTEYAKMGVSFPREMADYFNKINADMKEKEQQFIKPTEAHAATQTTIIGSVETVTEYNSDGTIKTERKRKVSPEDLAKEQLERCKVGKCTVCRTKGKPVNEYDLCEDCDKDEIKDKAARFHVYQMFGLLHKEEIADYEDSIYSAYNEGDQDGLRIVAEEFKDLCFSYGTGGQIYIEHRVFTLRKTNYSKGTSGAILKQAFDWWSFDLQLTEADF